MRKIFGFALAAAMMVGCGSNTKYTISGESEKFAGKYAYLQIEQGNELQTIDSVAVVGNAFTLKGEVEAPYAAYVVVKDAGSERPEMYAQCFVEAAEISIEEVAGERPSFKAVGGELNNLMNQVNDKLMGINERINAAAKAGDSTAEAAGEKELGEAIYTSIVSANGNLVGQDLLRANYYMLDPQQVIDAIDAMPTDVQPSFEKMKSNAQQALKVQPGNTYIDIVEKDTKGNEITLKSVVENKANKYVLIDFWASWCPPCMREAPYLTATYEKYHKKGFEIFGVSFDRAREPWLKAIEDKNFNWVHVSAVNYWDNQARYDYAVNSIPANFLIDCSTGKIIATALRGDNLEAKIAELLD